MADCLQRGGQLDRCSFSHGNLSSYFSRLAHLYALGRPGGFLTATFNS